LPPIIADFPIHVVTGWLGNSPDIARKHYLQTHEEHFQRAVEKGGLNAAISPHTEPQADNGGVDFTPALATAYDNMREDTNQDNLYIIPPRGLEPLDENRQAVVNKALTENTNPVLDTCLDKTVQKQGNFDTSGLPSDLAQIVSVWPSLPEHIKSAVKALVQTHNTEK